MSPLGPTVRLPARPPIRLFHLVFESHNGRGLGADSEEKREPVSDIDIAVVDSLKVLDPNRPIREADSCTAAIVTTAIARNWEFSPAAGVGYCSRGLTCRSTIPGSVNVSLARLRPEPSTKMRVGLEAAVIHRNSSDEDFRGKR